MKKILLLVAVLAFLPGVFAEITTTDPCFNEAGPQGWGDIANCIASTSMMGIDIALAVLAAVIVYSLFKYNAPMSVITPVLLVFAAVWIGFKVMTLPFEALFYYGLIVVAFFLVIGIIKWLWRT